MKQLRRELSGTKEKLEKVEAEAREKIRTLQRELALELEAKDEALVRKYRNNRHFCVVRACVRAC